MFDTPFELLHREAAAAPLPDAYRVLAYVQNHPLVEAGRDWAYDAIDEVYLDDVDSLLARIAYVERELTGGAETTWCARTGSWPSARTRSGCRSNRRRRHRWAGWWGAGRSRGPFEMMNLSLTSPLGQART
jgi:hypothetical protein